MIINIKIGEETNQISVFDDKGLVVSVAGIKHADLDCTISTTALFYVIEEIYVLRQQVNEYLDSLTYTLKDDGIKKLPTHELENLLNEKYKKQPLDDTESDSIKSDIEKIKETLHERDTNRWVHYVLKNLRGWEYNPYVETYRGISEMGYFIEKIPDYCNLPHFAWPIITSSRISITPFVGGVWRANSETNHFCVHKNPLLAALTVYLKMNGVVEA